MVAGTVPDESTRQAILARVRELYGNDRVVDQLGVGNLVAPPNWSQHVQRALHPDIKHVSRGQLSIQGNVLEIKGEDSPQNVAKRDALKLWVDAVNAKGGFGQWCWDVAFEPAQVHGIVRRHGEPGISQDIQQSGL